MNFTRCLLLSSECPLQDDIRMSVTDVMTSREKFIYNVLKRAEEIIKQQNKTEQFYIKTVLH